MQTMNISLPTSMREYVEEQVSQGGYSSSSEYFRDLVRADQKRQTKEALEESLLAAIAEGDAVEATPEWWEGLRQQVRANVAKRRAKAS